MSRLDERVILTPREIIAAIADDPALVYLLWQAIQRHPQVRAKAMRVRNATLEALRADEELFDLPRAVPTKVEGRTGAPRTSGGHIKKAE